MPRMSIDSRRRCGRLLEEAKLMLDGKERVIFSWGGFILLDAGVVVLFFLVLYLWLVGM